MNPMRFNVSCPDCGQVIHERDWLKSFDQAENFTCIRCGAHYSKDDFNNELYEKHMAQHHNHAKADLTQEEP